MLADSWGKRRRCHHFPLFEKSASKLMSLHWHYWHHHILLVHTTLEARTLLLSLFTSAVFLLACGLAAPSSRKRSVSQHVMSKFPVEMLRHHCHSCFYSALAMDSLLEQPLSCIGQYVGTRCSGCSCLLVSSEVSICQAIVADVTPPEADGSPQTQLQILTFRFT